MPETHSTHEEVTWPDVGLQYWGSNGYGKSLGIDLWLYRFTNEPPTVSLQPINARGVSDAARLRIPQHAIPALIAALRRLAGITPEPELVPERPSQARGFDLSYDTLDGDRPAGDEGFEAF